MKINILNSIIAENPMVFYSLAIIIIAYSAAFLVYRCNPKNRSILIVISIPVIISIICISVNGLYQLGNIINTGKLTETLRLFQMLMLVMGMLLLGGYSVEFKVKYIFVSHIITSILHGCFYFYCSHYDAGIIHKLFHPTFEYLVILAFLHLFVGHMSFPYHIKVGLTIRNYLLDRFLPKNESSSHNIIVLLQAYSMIIHSNFMVFIWDCTFDYLSSVIIIFVMLLQLIIIMICLRIMHVFPSSANTPFYVSAYLMIVKLLAEQLYKNYRIYKEKKSFNLQLEYFSNKFIYLFLCMFVMCALNCDVAYASDGELSSPLSEGANTGRYARAGMTFGSGAVSYEMVSAGREFAENRGELSEQGEALDSEIEECAAAKNTLKNNINYKLQKEYVLIQKVENYLRMVEEKKGSADVEDVRNYKSNIENYTTDLKASYETYERYKSNLTDQIYRRLFGANNCCYGSRAVKES